MHLAAFVDDVHAVSHDLTAYAQERPDAVERQLAGVVPSVEVTVRADAPATRPGTLLNVPSAGLALATPSVEAVPESLLTVDGNLAVTGVQEVDVSTALSELGAVDQSTFTLADAGADLVASAARHVSALALETAGGETHVGLGSYERLATDDRRRRTCERLADAGTLHTYGTPPGDESAPADPDWAVHQRATGELSAARFLVHDGAGDPRRQMAMLAVETEPGAYRGFLTFRPALVQDLAAYLDRTYARTAGVAEKDVA
jgi:hypothetical protein